MTYGPGTRTVAEVMLAVKRQFGDESGVQLEDADVIRWINDAQDEIVKRARVSKVVATASTVIGQRDYTFPTGNILQVDSLHYNGSRLPNMDFAQAEENLISEWSAAEAGTPVVWYEFAGTFTLYPTPTEVKELKLYYTDMPARVALSTDVLSLSDKFYRDVVNYVLQQAYEMDEDWQASQTKAQQFDQSISQAGEDERSAQNMTYDTIVVYDL